MPPALTLNVFLLIGQAAPVPDESADDSAARPAAMKNMLARREDRSEPAWVYGPARIAGAQLHVELDEREVWRKPKAVGASPRETYWFCTRPLDGGRG